jgi:hypothetical protein
MGDAAFDDTWEAAQRGDYLMTPPPHLGPEHEADPNLPVANRANTEAPNPPAPAGSGNPASAPGQEGTQPGSQDWTPPTREEWEQTRQKARHFDSFNGNFPKIQERWAQENLTPLQQQLQAREAELERVRGERAQVLDAFLQRLPYAEREQKRQEIAAYDQGLAQEIQKNQAAQQREAELAQREQYAQQIIQRAGQQEEVNLRQTVKQSVEPFTRTLAENFGVPKSEIDAYVKELGVIEFVDQAPSAEDLKLVGPLMKAVEKFATTRGQTIAADNARRAQENGTYRAEGTGAGAGGARRGVASMPDKDFESLWEAVKTGNNANRY